MGLFNKKCVHTACAIMLTFVTGSAHSQSDVGECGIEPAVGTLNSGEVLFRMDEQDYREDDLPMAIQQAIFDARLKFYKEQLSIFDSAIFQLEMGKHLATSGQSREEYIQEKFPVTPPSDDELAKFYEANRSQIPYEFEAVKGQLREMVQQQLVQAQRSKYIAQLKANKGYELKLPMPAAPYAAVETDGFPSKGVADAKITIVEFADYQCPHCKSAASVLSRLLAQYGNDLRVVFKDFPINRSGVSRKVALGAACADKQGKFWDYHDLAFQTQEKLNNDSVTELAIELNLEMDTFAECLQSEFPNERLAKSENEALELGVSSTPTLFINGRRLHLHDLESGLRKEIDKLLKEQSDA